MKKQITHQSQVEQENKKPYKLTLKLKPIEQMNRILNRLRSEKLAAAAYLFDLQLSNEY